MFKVILLTFTCLFFNVVYGAKILGVFIIPSISHQVVFQPIWKELSLRGHEVTVLTPNPLNDPTLVNLTEIDLGATYKILQESNLQTSLSKDLPITTVLKFSMDLMSKVVTAQLSHPEVQALIQDKNKHFDVMLTEFLYPTMYALSSRFQCPMIGVTSLGAMLPGHDAVGNPTHPAINPDLLLSFVDELGFFDRMYSMFFSIWYRYYYHFHVLPREDAIARKHISEDLPYLGDIEKNVSMLFLNENPFMHNVRPNVPAVIVLGKMHITKKKPLPKDLQKELDAATEGVVYFSLGSNVRSASLSTEVRERIIDALSEIPYKVLWKWEDENLPGKPRNVVVRKWFPQQDVLSHPNIKVFLTQGGLQSMEEAISSGVPVVGMPFMADQPLNVRKLVRLGIAQVVNPEKFTKEELKAALIEVAQNPKYRNKAREIADLTSDVPMTGLEKAVWWTEYVIRHKGARHLRSPAVDMPWYQYLLLDVFGFILAVTLISTFILFTTVLFSVKITKRYLSPHKVKVS